MTRPLKAIAVVPQYSSRYDALCRLPSYWRGRALGRIAATDAMDLTRDSLEDHRMVSEYEKQAEACKP